MNKSTPTKKKPIKAHRGRLVYELGGRPMPGRPRPFPGFPRGVRPPRRGPRVTPRPMPFPPPRRRPSPFVSGPPRGGRIIDPRIMFGGPRRGLGGSSMAGRALRKAMAERNNMQVSEPITQRARRGNRGMSVTKIAIGENDFRIGGLTLSTVNNLKKT